MMWDDGDGRWRMHDGASFGGGVGLVMLLVMLVLTIAVVVAVVAFLRGTTTPAAGVPVGRGDHADARAILRERFARGDIDEQDFRTRMRALDDTGT